MDIIIGFGGFIAAFGLAVFIHELGHFLAAKLFKVPVERFVIGFDKEAIPFLPRCIIERRIGGTVYGISLIPLGGYVKMSGTIHPEIEAYLDGTDTNTDPPLPAHHPAPHDKSEPFPAGRPAPPDGKLAWKRDASATAASVAAPRQGGTLQEQAMQDMEALYRKPFWQKTIIYSAGVVMNLLLAMAIIVFVNVKGTEVDAPLPALLSWMPEDSVFRAQGFEPGDLILAVDGKAVANQNEMLVALGDAGEGFDKPFTADLKVERAGASRDAEFAFDPEHINAFRRTFVYSPAWIDFVVPNNPADKAGIRRGDTIAAIDGEPIDDWQEFVHIVRASVNTPLRIEVLRGSERVELSVTPWESTDEPGIGQVGLMPGNPERVHQSTDFATAVAMAPGKTFDMTILYIQNLKKLGGKLVDGNVTAVHRELGGPVGIAQLAYRQAQQGFDEWLRFLILLNVALAVMNILPFPVLDGGHIAFAIYEGIFKRPVPPQILVPMLNGAVVFLLAFVVLVTFSDLFKVFS